MRTIVCLSSQRWDDGMWTNKQHIMSRLAREHRVIYVEYGLRPLPLFAFERARQLGKNDAGVIENFTSSIVHRQDNLYLFDCLTPLPAGLFPLGTWPRDKALYDIKAAMVARYLRKEGIDDAIVWVYHPGYGDAVDRIPKSMLVYDCVDNYPSFPAYRDNPDWIVEREARLCRKADLVTCTAPALLEQKRDFNPDNTFLVHNVGDFEHFSKARAAATPVAPELASFDRPVVGFVGAVSDYKLNAEWLIELADERPDLEVVVIGPIGDESPDLEALRARRNIHLLGHRPYQELPTYLKGFDVAVIPYRINEHTESVFPIKFFEFLATGTPVVISNLPALQDYRGDVEVASSAAEFVDACDRALSDQSESSRAERIALAESNSWSSRIARILELIDERARGLA